MPSEVVNLRDGGFFAPMESLLQGCDVLKVNVVKNLLHWLVDLLGVANSNGALENANTLRILSNNGINVLGLPKAVLLKPELEFVIQHGDERHWLLTTPPAERKEVQNVLGLKNLARTLWVGSKEAIQGSCGTLVKLGTISNLRKHYIIIILTGVHSKQTNKSSENNDNLLQD